MNELPTGLLSKFDPLDRSHSTLLVNSLLVNSSTPTNNTNQRHLQGKISFAPHCCVNMAPKKSFRGIASCGVSQETEESSYRHGPEHPTPSLEPDSGNIFCDTIFPPGV